MVIEIGYCLLSFNQSGRVNRAGRGLTPLIAHYETRRVTKMKHALFLLPNKVAISVRNFASYDSLERAGLVPRILDLYITTFQEWGERHEREYLRERLRMELGRKDQRPFASVWTEGNEVIGLCWGAVFPVGRLRSRLSRQKPSATADSHFNDTELLELEDALVEQGFSLDQPIQFWDEILIDWKFRGRGFGPIAELVRYGATRLPLNAPTLMWTDPQQSRWHKIAKKVWGAKVVYKTSKGVEFLLVYPTWRHKIALFLRLDRLLKTGQTKPARSSV
jgi:hypothetical protein